MNLKYLLPLLCLSFSSLADSLPVTKLKHEVLTPFIEKHCVSCHGPEKQKAKIRLDNQSLDISNNSQAQLWQDVLDTLNAGDMPPEKKPQPAMEELTVTLRELTEGLKRAQAMLSDQGQATTMRRLNRREYANSIKHLFGFTLNQNELPADDPAEHYDTIGSDQYFSAYLFDKYLEVGREIARDALKWNSQEQREVSSLTIDPEKHRIPKIKENVKKRKARYEEIILGLEAGKGWKDLGFKDAREFYYYMKFDAERTGRPDRYLKRQYLNKGIYLTGQWGVMFVNANRRIDPRGEYKIRILAGINQNPPERRRFLQVLADGDAIAQPKVHGTNHKPEWIEFKHTPKIKEVLALQIGERRHHETVVRFDHYTHIVDRFGDEASIFIDKIEIEGPFYPERSFFEKMLLDENEKPIEITPESSRNIIDKFAFEVFRHKQPNLEYINDIHQLFETKLKDTGKIEDALAEAMAVILSSPSFLYIYEQSDDETNDTLLTHRELAIRLAMLLWSSVPDAELYAVANNGTLKNPGVLRSQVDRMLDDPRSKTFSNAFMAQWMDLSRFDQIAIDNKKFPLFDKTIRAAVKQEPLEFFHTLIQENLSLDNLLDSDFIVINSGLAQHYGIQGVDQPGFHKVMLPEDSPRGGLTSTAAFSTMGSTGEKTSPIIRGALILEKLLHDPSPAPPPNVPQLNEASDKPLSMSETIKLHQSKAQCASCHAKMDPIGFGLENFNAIGQWRDKERVKNKTFPVKSSGQFPGDKKFENIKGFKSLLLNYKDDLAQSLVEGIMSYGIGRKIKFSDQQEVQKLTQQLREQNYQARSLIHAMVNSKSFQHK
ncbi:MAG: DUF1592 domain-containing protein [Lentisphaerales bacterium]|nr:DUF1592 domain-containing protein [Lentisphaerales bacterium]